MFMCEFIRELDDANAFYGNPFPTMTSPYPPNAEDAPFRHLECTIPKLISKFPRQFKISKLMNSLDASGQNSHFPIYLDVSLKPRFKNKLLDFD